MTPPVPVHLALQIRWSDLDALGHVNSAVYLSYFEQARLAYIQALLGPDAPIDQRTMLPVEFQFILAEATCHYCSPARLTDQLDVAIHVSGIGCRSFVFEYELRDQASGRLVAEGCTTQVWYDYALGASRPVPEDVRLRMAAMQGAPIPPRANPGLG